MAQRKPIKFHEVYCEGHHDGYGWVADGRSPRAETELVRRLSHLMIKRPRSRIWASQPPKIRQVIRLDVGGGNNLPHEAHESAFYAEIDRIVGLKKEAITENVIDGLAAGEKSITWTLTHNSTAILAQALMEQMEAREHAPRLREVGARVWVVHGGASSGGGLSVKQRFDVAREFRRHVGAANIIVTYDSMPESISLGPERVVDAHTGAEITFEGASTEHCASIHTVPGTRLQAENRPNEKGVRGLTIIDYVGKRTIDERLEALVLPRVETLDRLSQDSDAAGLIAALREKDRPLADMWADLLATMPDGDVAMEDEEMEE